jgi:hypothetical protein
VTKKVVGVFVLFVRRFKQTHCLGVLLVYNIYYYMSRLAETAINNAVVFPVVDQFWSFHGRRFSFALRLFLQVRVVGAGFVTANLSVRSVTSGSTPSVSTTTLLVQ